MGRHQRYGADQLAGESTASCKLGGVDYAGGIFTCHMIEGLSGGADADSDGTVSLDELYGHLRTKVTQTSAGTQIPQMSGALDGTTTMSTADGLNVEIPVVPKRYIVDASPHPLRPWIWASAGLTAAALGTAGVFNLIANSKADDVNNFPNAQKSRAEYEDQVAQVGQWQDLTTYGFIAAGGVLAATLTLYLWDLLDEPEDIDDVYQKEPWFRLSVAPAADGTDASAHVWWRF